MKKTGNESRASASIKGHVLLISPLTFSYHISISETLRSIGFAVDWWDERATNATWYKLALRLFPRITRRCSENYFLRKLGEVDASSITHVLVIKGEGMSPRIAFKIRDAFPSASMGFYLWDSAKNAKGAFDILPAFDSISTFDSVDAARHGWFYRPLFWRKIAMDNIPSENQQYDWCFVGTIHSDRHRVIHRLRYAFGTGGRSFVFGYFQSPLLMFLRKTLDWTMWFAPKNSLSTTPMPASEVAEIMSRSRSVLDVEHPQQGGLTMRTIETLLAGKKLVTTNRSILESNLYDPSRVHIISRTTPAIPIAFLDAPFLPFDDQIRKYYSCESWISELISLQDAAKKSRYKQ